MNIIDPIDDTFGYVLMFLLLLKLLLLKDNIKRKNYLLRYLSLCIIIEIGKNTFGKLRPDKSDYRSFPSGHSANVWFVAAMFDFNIFVVLWAIAVGISRIVLRKHDIIDVVGGAILGITVAKIKINDTIKYLQNKNYQNKL